MNVVFWTLVIWKFKAALVTKETIHAKCNLLATYIEVHCHSFTRLISVHFP